MPEIQIDIISDIMCPWCYIGKRRLEKAIALFPDANYEITWHPFLLDPTIPDDGMDRSAYTTRKFGENAGEFYENIKNIAASEGLALNFDKITRSPKTIDAHRLLYWAKEQGVQDAVSEALFKAYFVDGKDPTQHEVLLEIAQECGMDRGDIQARLASDQDREIIMNAIQQSQNMGVSGVPFFVINQKYGIAGAQDAVSFSEALKKIAGQASDA